MHKSVWVNGCVFLKKVSGCGFQSCYNEPVPLYEYILTTEKVQLGNDDCKLIVDVMDSPF